MAAQTKTMGLSDTSGKKVMLPAGGARIPNVITKSGLPTKPTGQNVNLGKK